MDGLLQLCGKRPLIAWADTRNCVGGALSLSLSVIELYKNTLGLALTTVIRKKKQLESQKQNRENKNTKNTAGEKKDRTKKLYY